MKLVSNHQASLDNLLSKFSFCHFTSLKCQSWRFPTFLENLLLRAKFLGKKHSLNRKIWGKSDFESIFLQRLRLLHKIITSCQSLNWISTKRQNLNQDFYHALVFDEKTVFRKSNFVGKLALKESFIWSIYTKKKWKLAFLRILGKVVPEKVDFFFFIKGFLDKISWNFSVFESFVVHVIFWIKNFKCVRLRAVFSQPDKFWIEILERVGFRKKVLQRIRFWSEIDL